MTAIEVLIQDGKVVLSPQQAAELGLSEGAFLPVTIEANHFSQWIGTLPPLPDGEDSAQFFRQLRDEQ